MREQCDGSVVEKRKVILIHPLASGVDTIFLQVGPENSKNMGKKSTELTVPQWSPS